MAIADYSFGDIPRPGERLLSGIKSGVGIQDLSNRRDIAIAAQKKQQALNDSIANLNEIENPTAADYTKVTSLLPKEQADSLRANWELRSKEYQANLLQSAGQTLAAFTAKPEVAMNLLRARAESERNSGNEADADFLDRLVSVAEIDPNLAKQTLGIMISSMPGGDKVIDSISKIGVEERKAELQPGVLDKQAAALGLTKAQTNEVLARTKNLGLEGKKAVLELEALKKGELSPEKKFDQEKKLRDEFTKKTANFTEGTRNYEVIKSSAADDSGAGDVALVTSFMKMLDPGSVVRETEFANARDTAGLYANVKNMVEKGFTGKFLNPAQRETFGRLAKKYLDAARKQQEGVRKDLGIIVKNYSLNEENVFGLPEEVIEEEVVETSAPSVTQVGRFQIEVVQ
jgi:hypothetical protein